MYSILCRAAISTQWEDGQVLLSIRHGFSTGLVPAEPGFMGGVEMRAGLKYFAVFSEQVPPSVESGCACPRFPPKKGGSCRSPAEGTPGLEGEVSEGSPSWRTECWRTLPSASWPVQIRMELSLKAPGNRSQSFTCCFLVLFSASIQSVKPSEPFSVSPKIIVF